MPVPFEQRRDRIQRILESLELCGVVQKLREGALIALSDDVTPHPVKWLRAAGHTISAGATTRQVFDYINDNVLHKASRIDRELRDDVFPPLIKVGLLEKATIRPRREVDNPSDPNVIIQRGKHAVPKSPNSAYVLTLEARRLICEVPAQRWEAELQAWLAQSRARKEQVMQAMALEALRDGPLETKHSRLIHECVKALLEDAAPGFELVYVDDADGDRVRPRWKRKLAQLGLKPDKASRWPDAILANTRTRRLWFVDAVISDGELDKLRTGELRDWAEGKGWQVEEMTTAYETWGAAARRQSKHRNLAPGTSMWILEDAGKLFCIGSLAGN